MHRLRCHYIIIHRRIMRPCPALDCQRSASHSPQPTQVHEQRIARKPGCERIIANLRIPVYKHPPALLHTREREIAVCFGKSRHKRLEFQRGTAFENQSYAPVSEKIQQPVKSGEPPSQVNKTMTRPPSGFCAAHTDIKIPCPISHLAPYAVSLRAP